MARRIHGVPWNLSNFCSRRDAGLTPAVLARAVEGSEPPGDEGAPAR
jgi:hypothetical protein